MAASQPRRAGVRRAFLILVLAVVTALATATLGPILAGRRAVELTGAAVATPSPARSAPASPSPSTSASPDPNPSTASPATSPTASASPSPTAPAAPSAASGDSVPSGPNPRFAGPRIRSDLHLTVAEQASLQSRLERLRDRYAIPGISVAIVMPNGTTWLGVSGVADVATKRPVTTTTAFSIASVSKTFTSALILSLAEEGRIQLNAPVRKYLPALKKVGSKVLVRQLLDHTSGLRDYFFHASIDHALLSDPSRRWNAAEAMRYIGKAYFKPGTGWHYSNTNYLVLGLLAEAVVHEPLPEQIRTRFLTPLGLEHTWYQPGESGEGDVARGYRFESAARDADAIDLSDGTSIVPFTSVITAAGGAGGFAADARDLAQWVRALYGGSLLTPRTIARMTDVRAAAKYKSRVPYGLGVQVIQIDGRRTFGHSGRLLGFRSAVRYLPDAGVSIAVLTNQSRVDPGPILRSLLKIVMAPYRAPCRCLHRD